VGPSSKSQLKEKWMRYWEVLDEITERHRFARVLVDDDEGRGLLADEAARLVVPSLERFMARNRDKDFTKSTCHPLPFFSLTDRPSPRSC
jgi:exocyst complex protein 7